MMIPYDEDSAHTNHEPRHRGRQRADAKCGEDGKQCVQDKTKTVGTSRTLRVANDGKVLALAFVILPTPPLTIQGPLHSRQAYTNSPPPCLIIATPTCPLTRRCEDPTNYEFTGPLPHTNQHSRRGNPTHKSNDAREQRTYHSRQFATNAKTVVERHYEGAEPHGSALVFCAFSYLMYLHMNPKC